MKKPQIIFALLILLVVSFVGGVRFDQYTTNQNVIDSGERKILHYVDPMNPANTSKDPGIAPCGMPMEPVYADDDRLSGSDGIGIALSTSPGAVKINLQKQQIIGVQIAEIKRVEETLKIRSLGRIAAEENKIFPLVAATDGWAGEIHESTTGSLVSKNQLMGKIKIYDYDFFTWQQRYLIELNNVALVRRPPLAPLYEGRADQLQKIISAQQQAGSLHPDFAAPAMSSSDIVTEKNSAGVASNMKQGSSVEIEPSISTTTTTPKVIAGHRGVAPKPWKIIPRGSQQPVDQPIMKEQQMAKQVPSDSRDAKEQDNNASQSNKAQPDPLTAPETIRKNPVKQPTMQVVKTDTGAALAGTDHSQHMKNMAKEKSRGRLYAGEEDKLYSSQVRQELMDLGVGEKQLEQLATSGVYITDVELRSPTDGLVLSRNIFPQQRITKGTECFRVADLSRVWVEADIYDLEAKYIHPGMQAMISMPKMDEHFFATVTEVLPRFDAAARTLKVRLEMDNPKTIFRPDMFVDVDFLLKLPQTTTLPSGAIINSGMRQTVYVVMGEGIFEPREVLTGWHFNDRVEIVKGLRPGERVVVSGNFLIDSESRMKLAATRLMDKDENPLDALHEEPSKTVAMPQFPQITTAKGTVRDPICGMNIDPDKAMETGLTIEAEGKTYYFCSKECAEDFHRHSPQVEELNVQNSAPEASDIITESGDLDMTQMTMSNSSQDIPEKTAFPAHTEHKP